MGTGTAQGRESERVEGQGVRVRGLQPACPLRRTISRLNRQDAVLGFSFLFLWLMQPHLIHLDYMSCNSVGETCETRAHVQTRRAWSCIDYTALTCTHDARYFSLLNCRSLVNSNEHKS